MKQCRCQYTIKVTEGNEWDLLLQLKTDTYESDQPISGDIDFRALDDVVTTIDGIEWENTIEDNGVMLHIPSEEPEDWQGQPWRGPHNVELTATYFGVEIRAAYFECFTIVKWSYESNVRNFIPEAPQASELAFVYVGITDDEELEALKQQYRNAIAATETARLQYEAAKEAYDEKAEALDDVAKQSTMLQEFALTLEAIAGIHIDIPEDIATEEDVTAAKQAILTAIANSKQDILTALGQIQPDDPYSRALAAFFGITDAYNPTLTPATDEEIINELETMWEDIFGTAPAPLPSES